nr:hypothetical protein CFP56_09620 [Quercus suber]
MLRDQPNVRLRISSPGQRFNPYRANSNVPDDGADPSKPTPGSWELIPQANSSPRRSLPGLQIETFGERPSEGASRCLLLMRLSCKRLDSLMAVSMKPRRVLVFRPITMEHFCRGSLESRIRRL